LDILEKIDINDINQIAKKAGQKILEIYNTKFDVEYKTDNSPLTEADLQANKIITTRLQELFPEIPILSEESSNIDYSIRKNWEIFWLIDPLDGTKEFVKRNGEFTVNIALIQNKEPVLGVVFAPVLNKLYYAKKSNGAFLNGKKLPLFDSANRPFTIVASRSHFSEETKKYIENLNLDEVEYLSIGSSLKLCLIAEGSADLYPRLAPTSEWDIAASDAILREVGKSVLQFENGKPLEYNKENYQNPWFIVK
jgi:3'(2'), 5'-bisphosphate nucleotidase